jgi:hypothetical protein
LDIPCHSRRVRDPVLAIYGIADFLADAAEHHFIGGIMNRQRPDLATGPSLEGMDQMRKLPEPAPPERPRGGSGDLPSPAGVST